MADVYTQRGTFSIKEETTPNIAVTPNVYCYFNEEDITSEYPYTTNMRISGSFAKKRGTLEQAIPAPQGTIKMNIEPKTFGYFLEGVFGAMTDGRYMPFTALAGGVFAVGDTITGVSSAKTATVAYVGSDYILVTSPSGDFTAGETIGNGGAVTATLTYYYTSVYGHAASLPATLSKTYSMQLNFVDSAHRFCGVRIIGIDAVQPEDNVMTAGIKIMAQSHFRHAVVQAIVSSGAGAKTITVDQVQGLVAADTIKVFRPSTGLFLDFVSAGIKTHTVGSISETALTIGITNLETALAVGDLIMLAPQTASYTTAKEFIWTGGSQVSIGATIGTVATEMVEEISLVIGNEYEERHAAQGSGIAKRFPSAILQKSCDVSGSFKMYYADEEFISYMRNATARAMKMVTEGSVISGLSKYLLRFDLLDIRFLPFMTNLTNDEIINQEIEFEGMYDSTTAKLVGCLLVNDLTTY